MKIMYLLFSFTLGGTEKLVSSICNEMSKRNNDVYLYIVNQYYDQEMFDDISPNMKVILKNREPKFLNIFKAMIDLYKYCKKENIDVIHCNSFDSPELIFLCKLFLPKIKIIYTIHNIGSYEKLKKIRVNYRNLFCNSILAISKSVYDEIVRNGADKKITKIVYNAIDTKKFQRKSEYELRKEQIIIGNVARINLEQKGQDILLKALNKASEKYNIKCLLAGEPDEAHQKDLLKLKKMADEISSEKLKIVFEGKVNNVPAFLDKLDIFVLPSRNEGFGISLIEAMEMEVPCVASKNDGPMELIGNDERGLLFEKENTDDLNRCIKKVIEEEDFRNNIVKNAKEYVDNNFNIEKMCEQLESIYSE